MTSIEHVATGNKQNTAPPIVDGETISNKKNETTIPVAKIIKSIVLKTPNINVPDFEFAGIKYEFTIYHTPFYYFNCSLDNSLPTATVAFIAAFSFSPTTSSIELYVDSAFDKDAAVLATNLS